MAPWRLFLLVVVFPIFGVFLAAVAAAGALFRFVPLPSWLTTLLLTGSVTGFTLGAINDTQHWDRPFFTNVMSSLAVGPLATIALIAVLERARRPILDQPWSAVHYTAAHVLLPVVARSVVAVLEAGGYPMPTDFDIPAPVDRDGDPDPYRAACAIEAACYQLRHDEPQAARWAVGPLAEQFASVAAAAEMVLVLLTPSSSHPTVAPALTLIRVAAHDAERLCCAAEASDAGPDVERLRRIVDNLAELAWAASQELLGDFEKRVGPTWASAVKVRRAPASPDSLNEQSYVRRRRREATS